MTTETLATIIDRKISESEGRITDLLAKLSWTASRPDPNANSIASLANDLREERAKLAAYQDIRSLLGC